MLRERVMCMKTAEHYLKQNSKQLILNSFI
jgi:hypothetical protein